MKKIRLILLALLLVSPMVQGGFKDGNELLDMCKAYIDETDIVKGNVCAGYLQGVVDSHGASKRHGLCYRQDQFCLPDRISTPQLVRITVKYLESHPEILHTDIAGWVIKALIEDFPCK